MKKITPKRPASSRARATAVTAAPARTVRRLSLTTLAEEEEEGLQTKAVAGQTPSVSAGLAEQLRSLKGGGRPLTPGERAFFEPRFGRDFSQVRIHKGAQATSLNRALMARAFTFGHHIAIRDNEDAPHSPGGRRLLAHELTHVVQQGGLGRTRVQRDEEEKPAKEIASTLAGPAAKAGATGAASGALQVCDPARKLTWADFTKKAPKGKFGAFTSFTFPKVSVGGSTMFKAKFVPSKSWVVPAAKDPTNTKATSCQKSIDACKKYIKNNPGGSWSFDGKPDPNCPASPVPDPSVEATTATECDTKIGVECTRVAKLESARLLRHEQLHFDLACVLAKKANKALAGGASEKKVQKALSKKAKKLTKKYDKDTNHGCKATEQQTWATDIGNGLPKETIP